MRETKFRVWDNEENNFWGEGRNLSLVSLVSDSLVNDDSTVLEQYTGLKDKNGVDIYEGDIVQPVRFYEGFERFPKIEPTKIGLPLVVDGGSYVYGKWIAREVNETGFGVNDYQFSKDLAVIGNIHENADLLEEISDD